MTATDELRRLLDERGVEWDYGITGSTTTMFSVNGTDLTFTPMRDGLVCSTILTPEQAIAATLGSCNCSNDCTNNERTGACHHAPTVEDVLAEFSVRVLNSGHQWGLESTEVIAEYAAKLRLVGDGE